MTELTPIHRRRLDAVLAAKREIHAELRRPLAWAMLKRILDRERVRLVVRNHGREAELLAVGDEWVVIVDRRQTRSHWPWLAAHELAHFWTHVDPNEPRSFDISPDWYDELREAEADYLAERMITGPVESVSGSDSVGGRKAVSKPARRAALPPALPPQLAFLDDDADEKVLREVAVKAAREDAKNAPVGSGHVQFALPRAAWNAISLAGASVPLPHYTNIMTGPDFELVTATIETASMMVELLARAGYKRTAVYIRRSIREAADPYEVRAQQRKHLVEKGAAKPIGGRPATWLIRKGR